MFLVRKIAGIIFAEANNMKIFTKSVLLLVVAAMVFALFGCSSQQRNYGDLPESYEPEVGGKIRVTCRSDVYPNESSQSAVRNWISAFRDKYPDVSVEVDFNTSDYAPQIAAKSIGDVIYLDDSLVYQYAITDEALMPLDSYIEVYGIDMENLYAGITDLGVANGKYYMAAMTCGQFSFVYNLDAMREAGLLGDDEIIPNNWTWDDFKTYCSALVQTNEDGTYSQMGAVYALTNSAFYQPFFLGYGGKWYDTVNKKINLASDDKVVQGVSELIGALEKGYIYPAGINVGSTWGTLYSNINYTSDCVFQFLAALTVLPTTGATLDKLGINWEITTWPSFEYAASPCGTLGFGVFSYSKNADTAAALVLTLYTEEGQYAIHSQTGGDVPVIKSLGDQDFWHLNINGWEEKNYSAFVANYERYVPGQISGVLPPDIASIVSSGWTDLLTSWFQSGASWQDKLAEIEEECNQTWLTLS